MLTTVSVYQRILLICNCSTSATESLVASVRSSIGQKSASPEPPAAADEGGGTEKRTED